MTGFMEEPLIGQIVIVLTVTTCIFVLHTFIWDEILGNFFFPRRWRITELNGRYRLQYKHWLWSLSWEDETRMSGDCSFGDYTAFDSVADALAKREERLAEFHNNRRRSRIINLQEKK